MRYTEFAPPPRLARWVECVWRSENPEPVPGFQVLPDGCLDLIYSAGASEEEGFVQAVGAMTVSQRFDQPARTLTGIRFHPGMAGPFLGVSPAELTDRTIAASGLPRRKLLQPPADQPNPVQRAIEALTRAAGDLDLEYVARQTNLSQRQFRRRCLEESGLTPNRLCRILRFRRAYRIAVAARKPAWAQIAAETGYFDQAHLIRDFREFAGATPMSLFSNRAPAAAVYDEPHEDYPRSAR